MKIDRTFYNRNTVDVARELLGKVLARKINGLTLKGRIVETEAYLGVIDKAAHSYGGKKTKRVEIMYGPPGRAYIYLIYGMYYCFNVVTKEEGVPEAVLIRGIEPLEGIETMSQNRYDKSLSQLTSCQYKNLSNGPGKLCIAMNLDKSLNGEDLCGNRLYIEEGLVDDFNIVSCKRIGIDYAEEAKDFLLRFYIKNNKFVSKIK